MVTALVVVGACAVGALGGWAYKGFSLPEPCRIYHFKIPRVRRSFGFYCRGNWWHELEIPGGRVVHLRRFGKVGGRVADQPRIFSQRDPYWRSSLSWPRKPSKLHPVDQAFTDEAREDDGS